MAHFIPASRCVQTCALCFAYRQKPVSHMLGKSPTMGDLGVSWSSLIFVTYENINWGFTRLPAIVGDKIRKIESISILPTNRRWYQSFHQLATNENTIFIHQRHQPYFLLCTKPIHRIQKESNMAASKQESENCNSFLKSLAKCAK